MYAVTAEWARFHGNKIHVNNHNMCVYIISKYQKDQSCLVDATQEDKLSNIKDKNDSNLQYTLWQIVQAKIVQAKLCHDIVIVVNLKL